jgi:hypothetical protein
MNNIINGILLGSKTMEEDEMSIEEGTKLQISQGIQGNFNSAESLTVISNNGVTIQFTLGEDKGYGSMPVEHLNYLLKRSNLTIIPNKRTLINSAETSEEHIS